MLLWLLTLSRFRVGRGVKKIDFFTYSPGESFLIENNKTVKVDCKKKQPKGKIVALSSVLKPSDTIINKLKEYQVTSIVKMASSYKFCVIAAGEYDIYAARKEPMSGTMLLVTQ